jgi:heme-degrading monooxygenase HmoA
VAITEWDSLEQAEAFVNSATHYVPTRLGRFDMEKTIFAPKKTCGNPALARPGEQAWSG